MPISFALVGRYLSTRLHIIAGPFASTCASKRVIRVFYTGRFFTPKHLGTCATTALCGFAAISCEVLLVLTSSLSTDLTTEYYVVCLDKPRAAITGAADYTVKLVSTNLGKIALYGTV